MHDKTPEEKYEERQKQSRPVMDAMFVINKKKIYTKKEILHERRSRNF